MGVSVQEPGPPKSGSNKWQHRTAKLLPFSLSHSSFGGFLKWDGFGAPQFWETPGWVVTGLLLARAPRLDLVLNELQLSDSETLPVRDEALLSCRTGRRIQAGCCLMLNIFVGLPRLCLTVIKKHVPQLTLHRESWLFGCFSLASEMDLWFDEFDVSGRVCRSSCGKSGLHPSRLG